MYNWKKIKCLALDVDGVLTDGNIVLDSDGEWRRTFYIRDGMGLILLKKRGYKTAIITNSLAKDIQARAQKLGIDHLFDNCSDKGAAFQQLLQKTGLQADEVAFMGDDVIDLPVFKVCGVSAAPADAHDQVRSRAQFISTYNGGRGAVRQVCDILLQEGALGIKEGPT